MKQAQNARKQRGRPAPRKGGRNSGGGGGAGNRSENRSRGNPKQLLEKYKTQARDCLQAGDRVTAEYYFQFADHYQRIVNETQGNRDQASSRDQASGADENSEKPQARRDQGHRDRQNRSSGNGVDKSGEKIARSGDDTQATSTGFEAVTQTNTSDEVAVTPKAPVKVRRARTSVKPTVDPSSAVQPAEVRPEFDLGTGEAEEKPKRKSPVRRRKSAEAVMESAPGDTVAQNKPDDPQGNEPV